jgi:hypothetical protein
MNKSCTISATLDVGEVDDKLSRDHAFLIVNNYIQAKVPDNHEFEYNYLNFGIQDSIDNKVQIMFSADVMIWSNDV